jgi:hypothetical protein
MPAALESAACGSAAAAMLLQDPENRQFVLADEPLLQLFGEKRFKVRKGAAALSALCFL